MVKATLSNLKGHNVMWNIPGTCILDNISNELAQQLEWRPRVLLSRELFVLKEERQILSAAKMWKTVYM